MKENGVLKNSVGQGLGELLIPSIVEGREVLQKRHMGFLHCPLESRVEWMVCATVFPPDLGIDVLCPASWACLC